MEINDRWDSTQGQGVIMRYEFPKDQGSLEAMCLKGSLDAKSSRENPAASIRKPRRRNSDAKTDRQHTAYNHNDDNNDTNIINDINTNDDTNNNVNATYNHNNSNNNHNNNDKQ